MVVCNTMEQQIKLRQFDKELFGRAIVKLEPNKHSLELEKEKFIQNMCEFIDRLNFETLQLMGRPKSNFKDIIKSLLMMSFNSMSYRRTQSDLRKMFEDNLISYVPPRSTLNDYFNDEQTKELVSKLIQASALFFTDNENTIILDSTWLGLRMYSGGYRKVHDKTSTSMQKCRKLHIACLKNSKVIAYAKATAGTVHDSPLFEEIVKKVVSNGFVIENLLADSGYSSKASYALCKELGILGTYIDFRSNASVKRGKSDLWKEKLKLFKEQKEVWHQAYKYRAVVEGVFSAIKRKNINYLRSRKETAQDIELLLKALVYNLTIIGRYS